MLNVYQLHPESEVVLSIVHLWIEQQKQWSHKQIKAK